MSQTIASKGAEAEIPRATGFRSSPASPHRPRRRAGAKAAALSPEARRAAEERNRRLIDEALAQGRVTRCPVRWALGAVQGTPFGSQES